MKIRWILLTFMVLSLVLTACGGDSGGGDAAAPVKDFFDAMEKKDVEKAGKSVCKEYRNGIDVGMGMLFEFGGDDLKFEVSDLKLKVEDEKDDEAMVVITGGKLKMTMAGETEEVDAAGEYGDSIKVIKEDGKWVICDPSFSEGFGP